MNTQKTVLVIEDDEGILEATKLMLETSGYAVETSRDGAITEQEFKNPPDIILLDYLLSGIDGTTIAKKLKANKKTSNIPIVMLSAHPQAALHAKDAGIDHFLSKPYEIDELLSHLKTI